VACAQIKHGRNHATLCTDVKDVPGFIPPSAPRSCRATRPRNPPGGSLMRAEASGGSRHVPPEPGLGGDAQRRSLRAVLRSRG